MQIYNCSLSCGDQYTYSDTLYCEDSCSNGYYTSPNKYCYKENCNSDKDYYISTIKNNKKVCSKKCYDKPYFKPPNECVYENQCPHFIIKENKTCVDKCDINSLYKYTYGKECVEICPENTKNNSFICVKYCNGNNNVVIGGQCKDCEPDEIKKDIENGEAICLKKCEEGKYYYEDAPKVCLDKCYDDDFIFSETQICVKECPLSYFMYYDDDAPKNKKICILKCPETKPYYENRRCEVLLKEINFVEQYVLLIQ